MRRTIGVYLGETPLLIGRLLYNQEGARESAIFEYDATWLAAGASFALDPTLPLVAGPQFHKAIRGGSLFPPALADTEPDGWGTTVITRDHAKRRTDARAAGTPLPPLEGSLDFLLAVDDLCRIGALRFRDEDGVFRRPAEEGRRTTPPLVDLRDLIAASRAVELHEETAADLAYLRGRGTSLGGMRPKCNVIDDAGHLAIGKFPSVQDTRAITKGEVLTLRLAAAAGIRVAQADLVMSDGTPVAVIRRFDRTPKGGRLLYVSAATLLGVERGEAGVHTYADIVDAIRVHGADAQADIDELFRRIAFTILVTNVDDHLHNHGFLHVEAAKWRLSPAFDINPFPERHRELKTWITEDTGPEATVAALLSAADYFGVPRTRAGDILRTVEATVATWRTVGADLGMTAAELDSFEDAFEHGERAIARRA
jgi:serine/threonine-protein kinase HipA